MCTEVIHELRLRKELNSVELLVLSVKFIQSREVRFRISVELLVLSVTTPQLKIQNLKLKTTLLTSSNSKSQYTLIS